MKKIVERKEYGRYGVIHIYKQEIEVDDEPTRKTKKKKVKEDA